VFVPRPLKFVALSRCQPAAFGAKNPKMVTPPCRAQALEDSERKCGHNHALVPRRDKGYASDCEPNCGLHQLPRDLYRTVEPMPREDETNRNDAARLPAPRVRAGVHAGVIEPLYGLNMAAGLAARMPITAFGIIHRHTWAGRRNYTRPYACLC
jgi:hypothetical protein